MPRLSPGEYIDYLREKRLLKRSGLVEKAAVWRGYETQTPEERIALGLELSIAAADARRAQKD